MRETTEKTGKGLLKQDLPVIGLFLVLGAFIGIAILFLIPLSQFPHTPAEDAGPAGTTMAAPVISFYSQNEPATDGRLLVTLANARVESPGAAGTGILHVTMSVQNLLPDAHQQVSAADFTLIDAANNEYPLLAIGDGKAVEIGPQKSGTYALTFAVPQGAQDFKVWYTFPPSPESSEKTVLFAL